MDEAKRKRLEEKGWKVGTVSEFLELSKEETALIEIKLALSRKLKERRQKLMTQTELAEKIQSSQLRIANAENGDASGNAGNGCNPSRNWTSNCRSGVSL